MPAPKLWHSNSFPSYGDERPGRQIKNPAVIRMLAHKFATESQCPCFKCPTCTQLFPLPYGRMARKQWPQAYEMHCLDCIKLRHLDRTH